MLGKNVEQIVKYDDVYGLFFWFSTMYWGPACFLLYLSFLGGMLFYVLNYSHLRARCYYGGVLSNSLLSWEFDRYDIVEGENSLWTGVSKPYRETIRAFLVYFQNQVSNRVGNAILPLLIWFICLLISNCCWTLLNFFNCLFQMQILRRSDESFCFSNGRCEIFTIAVTWCISVLFHYGA